MSCFSRPLFTIHAEERGGTTSDKNINGKHEQDDTIRKEVLTAETSVNLNIPVGYLQSSSSNKQEKNM